MCSRPRHWARLDQSAPRIHAVHVEFLSLIIEKGIIFLEIFFSIEIREKNEIVEIWPPRRRRHRSRTCWRRVWRRLVGFAGKGFFQIRFSNFSIENHRLFWVFETHLYSLCYIQSNAIISDTDYNVVFRQKVGFKFCQLCSIIT